MKLIEVVCLIFILPLFSSVTGSAFKKVHQIHREYEIKNSVFQRDFFIAGKFKKICSETKSGGRDFEDFGKICSSLWSLESFEVKTEGRKDGKALLRCCWSAGGRRYEVFGVTEKK